MSVRIRLASPSDAASIHDIYGPIVRDTFISFEETVPDQDEIAERIRTTLGKYPWLVCEIESQVAGYAYASAFRRRQAYQWTAETTVYVHPGYQRRGISRGLYASLIAILRAQGFCSAVGVIALPNDASICAHQALGFTKVGVFKRAGYKSGAWRDTGWWQLQLSQMPDSPRPPCAIMRLAKHKSFGELLDTGIIHIKP